ncbi:MAG: hypothetical protein LBI62_03055 [Candidatus Accumulibacter sp.]|nr:hypothetical protein [Accumulibacter sp.]
MKLNAISSVLFWGGLVFLGYLFWEYACIWWDTPMEKEPPWKAFWARKRKRATLAAVIMLVSMVMPSTRDAVIMTVVPAIARHSIWDRLLGSGIPESTAENARKWLQNNAP